MRGDCDNFPFSLQYFIPEEHRHILPLLVAYLLVAVASLFSVPVCLLAHQFLVFDLQMLQHG
jgi:hypothetical protein